MPAVLFYFMYKGIGIEDEPVNHSHFSFSSFSLHTRASRIEDGAVNHSVYLSKCNISNSSISIPLPC